MQNSREENHLGGGIKMTEQKRMYLAAILGATLFIPGSALAQKSRDNHSGEAARPAQARNNSTEPGLAQASLAKLAGDYDRIVKFVGQAGAMAAPSTGTSKFSVILGGRFLLEQSKDTVFGRPVEGLRIYGYNNTTGQYEMARLYTMSTGITLMKGTSTDGGKTIDYTGEAETSGTGGMKMHAVLRRTDDDHFTVTLSAAGPDGKLTPFQETIYTRKK
jgi:hypothetical protein